MLRRVGGRLLRSVRSLRGRLLLATVVIAVAAVGSTAWLTSRGTAAALRDDVENRLDVDTSIFDALLVYSQSNPTWDGVDDVVRELSERSGRRIALTTLRGRLIVDSARLDGGDAPPLPRRPAAVVDPFNNAFIGMSSGSELADVGVETSVEYKYTDEEIAARQQIVDLGAACLDEAGIDAYEVTPAEGGMPPDIFFESDDEEEMDTYSRCVDEDALYAPSAAEVAEANQIDRHLRRCLARRGLEITTETDESGFPLTDTIDQSDAAIEAYAGCYEEAERVVLDPKYSDPARLYIGTRNEAGLGAVLKAGRGRTLAVAGTVAALAVLVAISVSRRMSRPLVALTAAAQRMERGDLTQRVEVRGNDEVAALARSFNSMAEAVDANEQQRRRIVNDVAHELRTPLANIRGYVEAALDGLTETDQKLLNSLHEDAVLLQRLVDDLQTISLAEAGRLTLDRQPVDVAELAAAVVDAHGGQGAAAGVEVVAKGPGDPAVGRLMVDGDAARLRQALGNLVTNAVRYSSPGDRVTVRVRRDHDVAVVEVVDTGIGIDPEDLPHVFDRFWRADKSRARDTGGSGLGLAICRELVTAHGGNIEAKSTPGAGSTFTVRLPLAPN